MKYLVRVFAFNMFALWLTSQVTDGLLVQGEWFQLAFAGFVLSILTVFIKPLLKILFLPINLITFGLFSWAVNVIVIYILTIVVPEIQIMPWEFPGGSFAGFTVPAVGISYIASLIITSILITLTANLLHDVSEA